MSNDFISPEFNPQRVVVLSELALREKELWYNFLVEHGVKFTRIESSNEDGEEGENERDPEPRYVANIRVCGHKVPVDKAVPPGMRAVGGKSSSKNSHHQGGSSPARRAVSASAAANRSRPNGYRYAKKIIKFKNIPIDLSEYHLVLKHLVECGPESAKPRPLSWLMKKIEDMYDARYVQDAADLQEERTMTTFPVFVIEHTVKKYGLRSLVEKEIWEVVLNSSSYREDYLATHIFVRFLKEAYGPDDLLFFLYVRSHIQDILKISFKGRWLAMENRNHSYGAPVDEDLFLSYVDCVNVMRRIFGEDGEHLFYKSFMQIIELNMIGEKTLEGHVCVDKRRIEAYHFMLLAVSEYHDSRQASNQQQLEKPTQSDENGASQSLCNFLDTKMQAHTGLKNVNTTGEAVATGGHSPHNYITQRTQHKPAIPLGVEKKGRRPEPLRSIGKADRTSAGVVKRAVAGAVKHVAGSSRNKTIGTGIKSPSPAKTSSVTAAGQQEENPAMAVAEMQLELESHYLDAILHGTITEGLDEKSLGEIRRKISPQLHQKVAKEMQEYLIQTLRTGNIEGGEGGSEAVEGGPILDLSKVHDFIESVLKSKLLKIEMDACLRVLCKFAKDAQKNRVPMMQSSNDDS